METRETRYAIQIPGGLSFLAFGDPNAEVKGLEEFPREDWPNVRDRPLRVPDHGGARHLLALLSLWIGWARWRRQDLCAQPLAAPRARARGADGLHRDRGGLDRHRGRPPAVDHLRRPAHRRRGDADAGPGRTRSCSSPCSTASSA